MLISHILQCPLQAVVYISPISNMVWGRLVHQLVAIGNNVLDNLVEVSECLWGCAPGRLVVRSVWCCNILCHLWSVPYKCAAVRLPSLSPSYSLSSSLSLSLPLSLSLSLSPQSTIPKVSLFCFLVEEVRSTSYLEVPDSDTSFVVKVTQKGHSFLVNTRHCIC